MADGVIHPFLRATLDAIYGRSNIDKLDAAVAADRAAVDALSPANDAAHYIDGTSAAAEFLIVPDDAEAERFRREIERDASIGQDDW